MPVYCISYDLKSKKYEALIEAIKAYGVWWHQSESTWFIETEQTTKQVLDKLVNTLWKGDKIIVIQVMNDWWAAGHEEEEYTWLRGRNF